MNITDTFTADSYERMRSMKSEELYGSLYVGSLCVEVQSIAVDSHLELSGNCYVLGLDDDYGATPVKQTPYAFVDPCDVPYPWKDEPLEHWVARLLLRTMNFVKEYALHEFAVADLGDWT